MPIHTARLGKPRSSGEPSGATERKIRILLELIRNKYVRVSRLMSDYAMSERSVLRDFQELRKIGKRAGFALSEKVENDRIRLAAFEARPSALDGGSRALYQLMRSAAHALGKPVEAELATLQGDGPDDRSFMQFVMPGLVDGSRVADLFKTLEGAWRACARVRFRYNRGPERVVEPYSVILRSGRYYLLGRDVGAKDLGWRYFALDGIGASIARSGTFIAREVPAEYRAPDALGWIHGKSAQSVTVDLSPAIAPSATSRLWQRDQRVERSEGGVTTITFSVSDVNEVVRWTLGFGSDARVVAPPEAVECAKVMLTAIAAQYGGK
ncbi:MAG TPA: WYL domain-containing protein [Candidatus Baltobacteraceae bacterium]